MPPCLLNKDCSYNRDLRVQKSWNDSTIQLSHAFISAYLTLVLTYFYSDGYTSTSMGHAFMPRALIPVTAFFNRATISISNLRGLTKEVHTFCDLRFKENFMECVTLEF